MLQQATLPYQSCILLRHPIESHYKRKKIIKKFTILVTKKCTTFIGCKDRKKLVHN